MNHTAGRPAPLSCQDRTYESIAVGETVDLAVTVDAELVRAFATVSGDWNPLHCDVHYAVAQGERANVVHGFLLSSYFSQLVGMRLPGRRCLLLRSDLQFPGVTYVGDEVRFTLTVEQKVDAANILVLRATACRGEDVVVRGKIQVAVRTESGR